MEKEDSYRGECPCCGSVLGYKTIHSDTHFVHCTKEGCGFKHHLNDVAGGKALRILQENAKAKEHLEKAIESLKCIIEAESPMEMFETAKDALESLGVE